ncbi:hypothetical protein ACQCSU_00305 [Pseudarthrobacter sp. O4]|uniref:hypothetical protein n=1 Tax=Pseudarthrobacter sp. O4 TaxID=3418417 RepID=UPI003CEC3EA0
MAEIRTVGGADLEILFRSGDEHLIIFHGGHKRADLQMGQELFVDAGWPVLQPPRPGYGRTPL